MAEQHLPNRNAQERNRVTFMLITGFFLGVFIATYQVTADSLFLNRMGQYLDVAFLIAGSLGMVSTGIYSWLQNVVRFSVLTTMVTASVFVFTLMVYILLHFGPEGWHPALVFTTYCASGPIMAVLLLSYWGTFGRLFNFKQSKSIIGWIDTGQLLAAIMASLIIPLTSGLMPHTSDYLLMCLVSMFAMGVLLVIISVRFPLIKNNPSEFDAEVRQQTSMRRMFSDRYILLISSLVLASMLVFVLSQYAFQETVKEQYREQRALTDFMAFFTGAGYGISLLMQTFVNNRIIGNYGLRTALQVLPVMVLIFAAGAVAAGLAFGFEKETSPAGFIYFFLFVAMTRLVNWTLRDSLETPVLKLFFIPLSSRLRFGLQTKVEGLVNESSRFVAGLLIFGLFALPFFEVVHIMILLLVLCVVYMFIINKLHQGYRHKIRLKLEHPEELHEQEKRGYKRITEALEIRLTAARDGAAIFAYKLLERLDYNQAGTWVNALMRNSHETVKAYAQEKLSELKGLSVSDRYVIRLNPEKTDKDVRTLLSKAEMRHIIEGGGHITKIRIQQLTRSANMYDRLYAAELILHTASDECTSYLCELLQDAEPRVRYTAIKTAIKKHNNDVLLVLIDNLNTSLYWNHALNALTLIGKSALPLLDAVFYRAGQNTVLMQRIVQAIGRIGGSQAHDMLWNKISYPNKTIVAQVLLSLGECGFKANVSQITHLKHVIENDVADIRWNLGAIQELGAGRDLQPIITALRDEINNDIEHVYMLLAMLYDARSIQLVRENIESQTTEGITYAIELLDVLLSEQLKQHIIPVLDDISEEERIKRLDILYPRVRLDQRLTMKFIINRDYTQSNRWTKACVLHYIGKHQLEEFKLDLLAQLFNPDRLICEVAAWALWQISPKEYHQHVERLGPQLSKALDEIVRTGKMSRFTMVNFLKQQPVFEETPGLTLSYLADISEELHLYEGQTMVMDEPVQPYFYLVVKGSAEYYAEGSLTRRFTTGDFLGEMLSAPGFGQSNIIRAADQVVLLRFNKEQFYELLASHIKLADKVIEFV